MDLGELISSVSSTKVLTTDEALNLILTMKGAKPRQQLCFTSSKRHSLWERRLLKSLSVSSQQINAQQLQTIFNIQHCGKGVLVKSVFLLNIRECVFSKVILQSTEGKIRKLENNLHEGHPL